MPYWFAPRLTIKSSELSGFIESAIFYAKRNLGGINCSTKPQHQKQFEWDTADKTGIPKQVFSRSRTCAEKIAEDVQE